MSTKSRRRGGFAAALALFLVFVAFAYGRDPAIDDGGVVLPPVPGESVELSAQPSLVETQAASRPHRLSDVNGISRYLGVERPVTARVTPSFGAKVVARLSTRTPEGTTNVVLALERVEGGGRLWIQARLPILPNNSLGWIPRSALGGYNQVWTHLVVRLSSFKATLYRLGKPIRSARVGIGQSRWPTPTGKFYVRNRLTKYSSATYGPLAFGTSARSATLTDWPAGGFVGIHGTNQPSLIPGRISHGCIRLANADILRLDRLMQPGTPLSVLPWKSVLANRGGDSALLKARERKRSRLPHPPAGHDAQEAGLTPRHHDEVTGIAGPVHPALVTDMRPFAAVAEQRAARRVASAGRCRTVEEPSALLQHGGTRGLRIGSFAAAHARACRSARDIP